MHFPVALASLALGLISLSAALPENLNLAGVLSVRAGGTATPVATTPETSDPHDQFSAKAVDGGMVTCFSDAAPPKSDQLGAELSICGGIKAPIESCPGKDETTTGVSGKAKWTLTAPKGQKINIFKGRWEECCNAGRATCKGKTFSLSCAEGTTTKGPVTISLSTA